MRPAFFKLLYNLMERNNRIYALTGDLGYKGFDRIRDTFPDRFINCGVSEQTMMDMAVGLALSGKLPFTYTITPFYLRAFETLRTYINYESIPVIMIGSGRDKNYIHDGYSHDASDIEPILATLPNIVQFYPQNVDIMRTVVESSLDMRVPVFISLQK